MSGFGHALETEAFHRLKVTYTCWGPIVMCFPLYPIADLFEERKEVPRDVERRPDAIYLYGVDVMSTEDALQYFGDYGPTFVEWINDSSCK